MFCISHHILENTITSIKYNNTQERRLALFFRRKDFLWKKGPAEMGVFGNAVVFRITVGVRESQRVVVRRGMFSLCKDKPILFACVHSSVKQFSAHKVTQWQNQPPPPQHSFIDHSHHMHVFKSLSSENRYTLLPLYLYGLCRVHSALNSKFGGFIFP